MRRQIRKAIHNARVYLKTLLYGKRKKCNCCGRSFYEFKPRTNTIDCELYHQHHIIGAGNRPDYRCPYCNATDRERWLRYVVEKHTDLLNKPNRLLHFAAEETIYTLFRNSKNIDYFPCDINPLENWYKADITDIPFDDGSFDYVMSNHVLEHVEDEERAVSEIRRVLKDDGCWIFSFPICMDIKTFEDKSIVDPDQRIEAYGQKDHVRLYGNDFKERFGNYGWKMSIYTPSEELDNKTISLYGILPDDVLIIATKN